MTSDALGAAEHDEGEGGTTVFVKNLAWSTREDDLSAVFARIGPLRYEKHKRVVFVVVVVIKVVMTALHFLFVSHFAFALFRRSVHIATKKDPKNPGSVLSMGFAFVEFQKFDSPADLGFLLPLMIFLCYSILLPPSLLTPLRAAKPMHWRR